MALSDIVNEDMKWMDNANCVGKEKAFDNYEQGGIYAQEADEMCITCPVIKECFIAGSRGQWGQWGGVFWKGNGEPDLRANEHKSSEFMEEVERMVE